DLLSYARLDLAGAHFTPVACDRALQQALANLRLAIRESGATVTQGSLPTVMGDEFQVAQVFQNLVGNAVKFRRKDVDPVVHVDCELRDGEWLLSVRDNGIGLDPTYAQRIFEVFQRLHGREEYAGTGIGLSLCKKIVERHGGEIWCESSPGAGSTFFFTLPVAPSRKSRLGSEPLPIQAHPSATA
ncbi:MAG TPA: ATP-binding protein, partial [Planctomycetota bacterium]